MASMPVAAVTLGGRPVVNSASRMVRSAYNCGDTTPALVASPVVTIEIGVTSEPVPAVVGICTSGRRGPFTLPTPYIAPSGWLEPASAAISLATSIEEPPPRPSINSASAARACCAAANTTASGGSATTSSITCTCQPASRKLASAGASKPLRCRKASVTRHRRV
jgi:hypothetical protein